MSEKCYRCGTIYDGWSCPMCSLKRDMRKAQEEATRDQEKLHESQMEAIDDALEETLYEIEQAAERHERTVANADKLQATAKIKSAYELYRADLNEDAVVECTKAISLDPSNIGAYRVACWAYVDMGQLTKAKDSLEKQIKLLKTRAYANSKEQGLQVLRDILSVRDNKSLIHGFIDALKASRGGRKTRGKSYNMGFSAYDFIDELMKHSFCEEARQFFVAEQRKATKGKEALLDLAYEIELEVKVSGKADLDALRRYAESLSPGKRQSVFEGFRDIAGSRKFSGNTINAIRSALLDQYKEWKPKIDRELSRNAANAAEYQASMRRTPSVAGWVTGIAVFCFVFFLSWRLAMPLPYGWGLGLPIVLGAGAAVPASILISRTVRGAIRRNAEPGSLAKMRKEEEELLTLLQGVRAAPRQGTAKTKTKRMDKHERDYKGFGETGRFNRFRDADEAEQWIEDWAEGKL